MLLETKTLEFTIAWSKTYGNVVYVGTLYLSSYYHTIEKNTIAIYKGTLFPE